MPSGCAASRNGYGLDNGCEKTMRAIWANDVHLEFLDDGKLDRFLRKMRAENADCVLLGGDIAQADSIERYLSILEDRLKRPIHFVLGNHDYYKGSIRGVRSQVSRCVRQSKHLNWLGSRGVVELAPNTCLIGHDGWGDGRVGNFGNPEVLLNDFFLIEELRDLKPEELRRALQKLGDEAADHLRKWLPDALEEYGHVVVLIHVSPFIESSWFAGRPSDENWRPYFVCDAAGRVLREAMAANQDRRMTVLCGHTHGGGICEILPNLTVHTGPARYGRPRIQKVFEWG